ncbi:cytochrome P450 [Solihabitans fulvus]|uniref:Cytochrome P450 n=1 Tax=Solihabitans fulvus TaxID=1892852 RepID=A0A5B2X202_9PSEU|nr:cytochrome P450 [Solihabitans fulvus]KAA2257254.1 cytochrome P450 [Solihabitans fulvus]
MTETPAIDPSFFTQLLPFDPFDPAFHENPYAVYRTIRERGSVVRTPMGLLAVSGYEECSSVLRSRKFGWGDGASVAEHFSTAPDGSVVRPFMFMDPPEHTRVRSLVGKAFAARRVDRLRARATEIVVDLVEAARTAAGDDPIDLMAAVAHPAPAIALSELLGVPPENRARFQVLSNDIAHGLDPSVFLTPEEIARRDNARAELNEYFAELVALRRAEPADDLVSELVAAEEGGDRLTGHELLVTCTLLLSAGYATTVNLIGNGMFALLRRPDQQEWLRANPDQVPGAVEEMLRFDAPVQMISRVALEEVELAGLTVNPGEQLMLMIGAANHDPAVFDDPDSLVLSRTTGHNLGFSLGAHFCVGAPFARLTAQVAVGTLAGLDLTLATDNPTRVPNIIMRGLAELPVRVAG